MTNIEILRRADRLSQKKLAELAKVDICRVQAWEAGQTPDEEETARLCEIFAIDEGQLTGTLKDPTRSGKAMVGKMPLWSFGQDAYGFFACGIKSKGVFSIGMFSTGAISIGFFSCGIVSIGLFSLGMAAIGLICAGIVALGNVSAGIIAVGLFSAGLVTFGVVPAGYLAMGIHPVGIHTVDLSQAAHLRQLEFAQAYETAGAFFRPFIWFFGRLVR